MLTEEETQRAAKLILDACAGGRLIEQLPAHCTPTTIEEAYAIQAQVFNARQLETQGWYVAATNPDMQRQLGLKEAFSARWGRGRFLLSGAEIAGPGELPVALEAEITLRLGRSLPVRAAPYRTEEVAEAVEAVHPSFEVVISCFSDWPNQPALNLIAEGGPEQYLVLGGGVDAWRCLDLEDLPVEVTANNATVARGHSANVMGGPLNVLTWLANHASRRGIGLRSQQLCNTGMCAPLCVVKPGDRVRATFGALGMVELSVTGRGVT